MRLWVVKFCDFATVVIELNRGDFVEKTLTENELKIRQQLAVVRKYPRWKYMYFTKGFLCYTTPKTSEAEAFKHPETGRWSAGQHPSSTWRDFNTLEEALQYGEQLVQVRLAGASVHA